MLVRTEQDEWTDKIIPPGYRHCSFSTFNGSNDGIDWIKSYALKWPASNLCISGPCGSGKTHLAISILRKMIEAGRWLYVWFMPATDMLLEIKSAFEPNSLMNEADVIDKYVDMDFLVIDDLGAEYLTDWVISTFYRIIDRRFRDAVPTLITTNLSTDEIEARFGARIASRISNYTLIQLRGRDFRKMNQAE